MVRWRLIGPNVHAGWMNFLRSSTSGRERSRSHYKILHPSLFPVFQHVKHILSSLKLPEIKPLLYPHHCVLFACVGVQQHATNTASALRTNFHFFLFLFCFVSCFKNRSFHETKSPPINWRISQRGGETHQIFNTQWTYQLQTAHYGFGHLPEC